MKKIKPLALSEEYPAYRSCPHPIAAASGHLASDGGCGMRLSAPAKSLLNHLLGKKGSISWRRGKGWRWRSHMRHRLGSRRLVPANEDRGHGVEGRRVRCREIVGGQRPSKSHINGVVMEAMMSRRAGMVKRAVRNYCRRHRCRANALVLIGLGRAISRSRGGCLRTKL